MDAGNRLGDEGAASLVPAFEKMPQLTSLGLGCARIRFWARRRGVCGVFFFGCVVLGTRLDAVWCGWGMRLRAGDACDGLRGVCLSGGRRWMQAITSGVSGICRSWRRCRSSPRSTSLVRGFAFLRGLGGVWGVFVFGAWCWVRAWMRCEVVGVCACGQAMLATDCEVCSEGAGGDGCSLIRLGRELCW
jgi:hypothetical protein